ncbi:unnamed protein product [Spirodela intermedia]|uniref:Uncharacterized protein n=1 Tax=Spirodela intermedia TaxID=51605 RepID=A0A7I8LIH7_SPIIN|nr:unnamed protein product [Spirodela intermedia]
MVCQALGYQSGKERDGSVLYRSTQLDITKMAKETWELFKAKYVGVTCLTKSRLQGLRREFEMLQIGDDETVTDFVGKLS